MIPIYLRYCKIPKGYSATSSNITDYVNIVEITSTQHYTRIALNRFPEQKMLANDRMETASTEVTSIRYRNDMEKSTWRTDRYFVDFESRIHVEISTSNRCHNVHVDSPFKGDVTFTNSPRGISISISMSIGNQKYMQEKRAVSLFTSGLLHNLTQIKVEKVGWLRVYFTSCKI